MIFRKTKSMALYFFSSRITQQLYPDLQKKFIQKPTKQAFGEFYHRENLLQIFNIIREANISSKIMINNLKELEKICTEAEDLDFNVLANIYREKAKHYRYENNLPEALVSIEASIEAIQAMERPHQIEVADLYSIAALLYLHSKEPAKCLKYLKDAENTLLLFQEEVKSLLKSKGSEGERVIEEHMKGINYYLAKVYTLWAMKELGEKKISDGHKYNQMALEKWSQVGIKSGQQYGLAVRNHCLLLLHQNLKQEAIEAASQFVQTIKSGQELGNMWFYQFLAKYDEANYGKKLQEMKETLKQTFKQGEKQ